MIDLKNTQFLVVEYDIDSRYLLYDQTISLVFKKTKCSRIIEIGGIVSVEDKNFLLDSLDGKEIEMEYKGMISPRNKSVFSMNLIKIRRKLSLDEILN